MMKKSTLFQPLVKTEHFSIKNALVRSLVQATFSHTSHKLQFRCDEIELESLNYCERPFKISITRSVVITRCHSSISRAHILLMGPRCIHLDISPGNPIPIHRCLAWVHRTLACMSPTPIVEGYCSLYIIHSYAGFTIRYRLPI